MSSVARFVARDSCARLAAVGPGLCSGWGVRHRGTEARPRAAARVVPQQRRANRRRAGPSSGRKLRRSNPARSLRSAQRVAARHGCEVRVANASSILSADFDTHRVDVKTKDGLVIAVRAS